MKKYFYTLICALFTTVSCLAQNLCTDNLVTSLDPFGMANITAEMVLLGNMEDFSDLDWQNLSLSCDDVGDVEYTINGNFQGAPFSCAGTIAVEDKSPPVPVCIANGAILIPSNVSEVQLDPAAFDFGSYDNCTDVTLSLAPETASVSDIGSVINVYLNVVDGYGNSNYCISELAVLEGNPTLICNAQQNVHIENGSPVTLEPRDLLANENPYFGLLSLEITTEQEEVIPNNTITQDHVGLTLLYEITDVSTNNTCWGQIEVTGIVAGEGNDLLACNDHVYVSVVSGTTVEITPDMLLEGGPYDYTTVVVDLTDQNDNALPSSPVIDSSMDGQLLNAQVTDTVTGVSCWGQIEVHAISDFFICDTQSRCTEFSDCNGGHSDQDHVEWPCDLEFYLDEFIEAGDVSALISPDALVNELGADALDSGPNLIDVNDNLIGVNYSDHVFTFAGLYKILRTWTVVNWQNGDVYEYVQIIRLIFAPGSIECSQNVVVSLTGFDGTASLFPEIFVNLNSAAIDDLVFYPESVDCSNIGENMYHVSGTIAGEAFLCEGTFTVEEKFPPVAVCVAELSLFFEENVDTMYITPDMIDNGSFDVCSDISMSVSPEFITSDQLGTIVNVTLTVEDDHGNWNSCWTQVAVGFEGNTTLVCLANITLVPSENGTQLYVEDFLALPYSGETVLEVLDPDGNAIPNNIVTNDHLGMTLTYVVTDPNNGNSCWGTIVVQGLGGFFICDTQPRCTDFTGCEGGHSANDNIEWPCDIELSIPAVDFVQDLFAVADPDNLHATYGVDNADTYPQIVNHDGEGVSFAYSDTVLETGDLIKIIREWSVLHWTTGEVYTYIQIIRLTIAPVANSEDQEFAQDIEITVFPNPVIEMLQLSKNGTSPQGQTDIFTISGNQVLSSEGRDQINVGHLQEGMYLLRYTENGQVSTQVFMKN